MVPEVLRIGESETETFLLMEYIRPTVPRKSFWELFGSQLAELHRNTVSYVGNSTDNYIGSLPQSNAKHHDWSDFFILERLTPLVKMARDNQRLTMRHAAQFDILYTKIESIFPNEKPALLHGDLWSRNFMCPPTGLPVLVDPAVYYGHREMDIAMTRLFSGFSESFYASYNEHYAMEKGWEERVDLCNHYPLLVHLNLFGGSYLHEIEAVLRYVV